MKEKIKNELLSIGYNPTHLGTIYLVEAIYIIVTCYNSHIVFNLERDIYIKLSEKYNKNVKTMQSDIVKSTNFINNQYVAEKYNIPMLKSIKLTPKIVISIVRNKLNI